jgi:hypothetical protein
MRAWISLGFLPVGSVAALLLLVENSLLRGVLALIWTFTILPHGSPFLIRRSASYTDPSNDSERTTGAPGPVRGPPELALLPLVCPLSVRRDRRRQVLGVRCDRRARNRCTDARSRPLRGKCFPPPIGLEPDARFRDESTRADGSRPAPPSRRLSGPLAPTTDECLPRMHSSLRDRPDDPFAQEQSRHPRPSRCPLLV